MKRRYVPPTVYQKTSGYWIFFRLIARGLLHVDLATGAILKRKHNRTDYPLVPMRLEQCNGYYFVCGYYTTMRAKRRYRRKISVHRLVWMVANHRTTIPIGKDVAHKDHIPSHNWAGNLELQPSKYNRWNSTSFGPRYRKSEEALQAALSHLADSSADRAFKVVSQEEPF